MLKIFLKLNLNLKFFIIIIWLTTIKFTKFYVNFVNGGGGGGGGI